MNTDQIRIGGHMEVLPEELIYLKGEANYTHIHFINGTKITVATTLKILEERLEVYGFYRTHKNSIVNLHRINSIKYSGTAMFVFLQKGNKIEVAKRRQKHLKYLINYKMLT